MKQIKITQRITNRDSESVNRFFNEVSKYPLISAREEIELAEKARNGDELARTKLIQSNLRFVISVAKQYQGSGVSLPDLINEGCIGLIKAAHKFDETKGFKFISYAVWWIRQKIMESIPTSENIVRVPQNRTIESGQINRFIDSYVKKTGERPSGDEICESLNIDKITYLSISEATSKSSSLDSPIMEGENTKFSDTLPSSLFSSPDQDIINIGKSERVISLLSSLKERDAKIVKLHFGIGVDAPWSFSKLSEEFGTTRERVRQIVSTSIRKLSKNKSVRKNFYEYI